MKHHYKKCSTLSELTEWLDKMSNVIDVVSIFSQNEHVQKFPTTIIHNEYVIIYRYRYKEIEHPIVSIFNTSLPV